MASSTKIGALGDGFFDPVDCRSHGYSAEGSAISSQLIALQPDNFKPWSLDGTSCN